jgi:hypothetical protein
VHLALVLSGVPLIGELGAMRRSNSQGRNINVSSCRGVGQHSRRRTVGLQPMKVGFMISAAGSLLSVLAFDLYHCPAFTACVTPVLLCPACTVLLCPACTAVYRQTLASAPTSVRMRRPTPSSPLTSASVSWPKSGGRSGTSGLQPWPSPSGGEQLWCVVFCTALCAATVIAIDYPAHSLLAACVHVLWPTWSQCNVTKSPCRPVFT